MDALMRKLLQLEAFELRTLAIDYRQANGKWPESLSRLLTESEYRGSDALDDSGWTMTFGAGESSTSYWTIKVTHDSGVSRTFCVDMP